MVALGYLRQVQLFRARPAFEHLATVPVPGATGAVWALRQLYIATTTSVAVAFVSPGESRGPAGQSLLDLDDGGGGGGPAEPVVSLVTLAAISGSDAVGGLRAEGAASGGAALPAPAPRPPGPVALLGVAEGGLWLVTSYGQPMVLPLTHPGVRARCLASMGDVMGAVQVAAAGLAPRHHDDLASFLGAVAGPTGAHMALLGLPGLSLPMEVELCIATGPQCSCGHLEPRLHMRTRACRHAPPIPRSPPRPPRPIPPPDPPSRSPPSTTTQPLRPVAACAGVLRRAHPRLRGPHPPALHRQCGGAPLRRRCGGVRRRG